MKSTRIMTAIMIVLFLALAMITCASAAEVRPVPVDHDLTDLGNGMFSITIRDRDRISNGGYFIAVLYQTDCYDGEQIRTLVPGDTVYADDRRWTVKEIVLHSDGENPDEPISYEIYTEEEMDGYLVFQPREDGKYEAVINDWSPVVLLGSVKVRLPLAENFEYIRISAGEEGDPVGTKEFIDDLGTFNGDSFSAYNTTCEFRDGKLIRVISSSYPQGPEEYANDELKPVPVWKFCHGLRDGLDTAVITGYSMDCEEGSSKIDMTPEEIEGIRSLALNGMVIGKASDESVTGGTWVYSFETPGGKHLLSVELYKGMIVAADGMYQYQK